MMRKIVKIILLLLAVLLLGFLCGCSSSRSKAAQSASVDSVGFNIEASGSAFDSAFAKAALTRWLDMSDVSFEFYPPEKPVPPKNPVPGEGFCPQEEKTPPRGHPPLKSLKIGKVSAGDSASVEQSAVSARAGAVSVDSVAASSKKTASAPAVAPRPGPLQSVCRFILIALAVLGVFAGLLWYRRQNK